MTLEIFVFCLNKSSQEIQQFWVQRATVPYSFLIIFFKTLPRCEPRFDLLSSVVCTQPLRVFSSLRHAFARIFSTSITEGTYSSWISFLLCGNLLPRWRSFKFFFPTSSICNPTQFILRESRWTHDSKIHKESHREEAVFLLMLSVQIWDVFGFRMDPYSPSFSVNLRLIPSLQLRCLLT